MCDLPKALKDFFNKQLGGCPSPPVKKIDKFNAIRNFGYNPVLDPDKDFKVAPNGLKYRSSGNRARDKKLLSLLQMCGFGPGRVGGKKVGRIGGLIRSGAAAASTAASLQRGGGKVPKSAVEQEREGR